MTERFAEVITTREQLREIVGEVGPRVAKKVIDHVDDICRRFIAASPYAVIATRGADGLLDVSPKGDPAGFVRVLDDKTLLIPDRLGNGRVDSFENLLFDPHLAMIFLIPGYGYTLRVSGTAQIVRDAPLREDFAVNGRAPNLVLAVTVEEAFMHCAKSIARAGLWKPDAWPDDADVPSLAEAMVEHGRLAESRARMQEIIDDDFRNNFY